MCSYRDLKVARFGNFGLPFFVNAVSPSGFVHLHAAQKMYIARGCIIELHYGIDFLNRE